MTVMTSLGFLKTIRRDIPTNVGAIGLGESTREEVSRKPSETSSSTGGPMWVKPAARGRNAGPTAEMTLVERRVTTVMSAGITLYLAGPGMNVHTVELAILTIKEAVRGLLAAVIRLIVISTIVEKS